MLEELENKPGLLITRLTIPNGEGVPFHRHLRTHEYYQILSGTGTVAILEEDQLREKTVAPYDFISIPPNTWHKIWNDHGQEIFPLIVISVKDCNMPDIVMREG